jgi:ATP:corrinoid adenosyltransferase
MTDYSPEMVTKALMQLVANGGNLKRTTNELIDDEFQVPESTLRYWRDEEHSEQYRRLDDEYGRRLESEAIDAARQLIAKSDDLQHDLLDQIKSKLDEGKLDTRDLGQTLRAATDTKAKNVDRLLALTGRPVHGQVAGASDIVTLVEQMIAKGYVRAAAGIELQAPMPQLPKGDS